MQTPNQNRLQNNVKVDFQRSGVTKKSSQGVPDINDSMEGNDSPGELISGDLEDSSDDPKTDEEDLNCKLCNKWFTYTAPDK